mmetsp:Transcript_30950/g.46146  ORF Transcript_30950/g.46146 Transcript_30950/m.46146 type:complete len:96 (-) Transcript_30950:41-328(-)
MTKGPWSVLRRREKEERLEDLQAPKRDEITSNFLLVLKTVLLDVHSVEIYANDTKVAFPLSLLKSKVLKFNVLWATIFKHQDLFLETCHYFLFNP